MLDSIVLLYAFSALTLLIGLQHLAFKNRVVRYWRGNLSGAGLPRLSWKKGR